MTIRTTTDRDIDAVTDILEEAKKTIAALGIDQWQKGYPNRESVVEDVRLNRGYVAEREGRICGTFVLLADEPTYERIYGGAWLTGGETRAYYALHRVAIALTARGSGVAEEILAFAEAEARKREFSSLRVDTHEGNRPMRRMLERNGFCACGTILLANGDPRVAYEKIL